MQMNLDLVVVPSLADRVIATYCPTGCRFDVLIIANTQ